MENCSYNSELEKFNTVLRKVISVPRAELLKREKEWKRKQKRKKQQRKRRYSNDVSTKTNA